MPTLDQVAKLLVEEGQQQALNMQAVHIGVGSDNHAVKLKTADIK